MLQAYNLFHPSGNDEKKDYVQFGRKQLMEDGKKPLLPYRVMGYKSMFTRPEIETHLREIEGKIFDADSYWTLNGSWRPRKKGDMIGSRCESNLSYLCAAYCDLDFGRPGKVGADLTFWTALAKVGELTERGIILPPSIISRSGIGAWLFWILRARKNRDRSESAFPDVRQRYKRLLKAISTRIQQADRELCPDISATDCNRFTRVPNSIHSTAKRRVDYMIFGLEPQLYSLNEMCEFFLPSLEESPQLQTPRRRQSSQPHKAPGTKPSRPYPKKKKGTEARMKKLYSDIAEELPEMRDGIRKGCRFTFVEYCIALLCASGRAEEIGKESPKIARKCKPQLRPNRFQAAVDLGKRKCLMYLQSYVTIGKNLKVTPEEVAKLQVVGRVPAPYVSKGRKEEADRRRELIPRLRQENPSISMVELARRLETTSPTIKRDLKALGIIEQTMH